MKHIFYHSSILLFIFLNISCQSQTKLKDDYSTKIDSILKTENIRSFNGNILISQNGKTKYSKSYGFKNKENKTKLKLDDNFIIMSNSKQITAVLILMEVDKGKINPQSPIKQYLPELNDSWADTITVHQLLNHTSGIDKIGKPLLYKPGTSFNYGNQTYNLLGKIISNCNKEPFESVARRLFKKLKMTKTFANHTSKGIELVNGHLLQNNTITIVDKFEFSMESLPAAGIISTVNDLAIWNKNVHHNKILKPETYNLMISYNVKAKHYAFGDNDIGYAYGVRIKDDEYIKMIGHTGMGSGYVSINFYFPENDTSLIILENTMNEDSKISYHFESEIRKIVAKSSLMESIK
ncbi:serine hydrolase domain-containing protein [Flavobacterium sp.]|uniref:serine hydrolase domain-containing protein n=1 Tax=Flavobacterium sp. TaxID=239 RepID=UPI00286E73FA|nr:serine hydrolase domain-containing protein [Flavobacterium sp.]